MSGNHAILLSTACFPPVQYFTKLVNYETVYIEQYENFPKQTYRNRYEISGANGVLPLVVPVTKGRDRKINIRDLKISYDVQWQRNHWRTLFSAYNSSPFFEYYCDDIEPFFLKPYKFLFDFNHEVLTAICSLLEIEASLLCTTGFEEVPAGTINFREAISPKQHRTIDDLLFDPKPYTQVFSEKSGFLPNLSILDLLFNEGPNSVQVIENSIRRD